MLNFEQKISSFSQVDSLSIFSYVTIWPLRGLACLSVPNVAKQLILVILPAPSAVVAIPAVRGRIIVNLSNLCFLVLVLVMCCVIRCVVDAIACIVQLTSESSPISPLSLITTLFSLLIIPLLLSQFLPLPVLLSCQLFLIDCDLQILLSMHSRPPLLFFFLLLSLLAAQ
jgi:hypothetical protein